jgi:hypothetical protein
VSTSIPKLKLSTAQDVLAYVPYELGFQPSPGDLVIVSLSARRAVSMMRLDIPGPDASEVAGYLAGILDRQHADSVVIIGYGPASQAEPALAALRGALAEIVTIRDVLRVTDGRWWSLTRTGPACSPPEGTVCDPGSTIIGATLTFFGSAPLRSRAELAATIAPLTGPAARSMRKATLRAEATAIRLVSRDGPDALRLRGLAAVQNAIGIYRAGGSLAPDARHAWLALVLLQLPVRDDAWARMDPPHSDPHQRMWTDMVRRAQPGYVAAPASMLAFTAWQAGDGALANLAIDRALADDPGYSMAQLLHATFCAGAPPSLARLPMTPEEVAASYAEPAGRPAPETPAS